MTEWSDEGCTCENGQKKEHRTFKNARNLKACKRRYPNVKFERHVNCGNTDCPSGRDETTRRVKFKQFISLLILLKILNYRLHRHVTFQNGQNGASAVLIALGNQFVSVDLNIDIYYQRKILNVLLKFIQKFKIEMKMKKTF